MNKAVMPRRPDEHGVPDPFPYMHPTLKDNYGNWAWHDRPRPGVLHHMAHGGDEILPPERIGCSDKTIGHLESGRPGGSRPGL